jgi:hypothetical protein
MKVRSCTGLPEERRRRSRASSLSCLQILVDKSVVVAWTVRGEQFCDGITFALRSDAEIASKGVDVLSSDQTSQHSIFDASRGGPRTYCEVVVNRVGMSAALCQVAFRGPRIPHGNLLLHLLHARHVDVAQQEGRAPECLQLGDQRRVHGVDLAEDQNGAIPRIRKTRRDEPAVEAPRPVRCLLVLDALGRLVRDGRQVGEQLIDPGVGFGVEFGP